MAYRPTTTNSVGTTGQGPVEDAQIRRLAMFGYALGAFSGVILLAIRRENRFLQFHALQSIALTVVGLAVIAIFQIFAFFPLLGFLYRMLLALLKGLFFLYWLFLIWQAHRGRWYRVPTIGAWAERQLI